MNAKAVRAHIAKKVEAGRPLFLLLLVMSIGGIALVGMDIYVPALPEMVRFFHTTPELVKFSLACFAIGLALFQWLIGPLSDYYGRRPIVLSSLFGFFVSSLFCGFSTNITALLIGRFVQGVSLAGALGIARTIGRDFYCGKPLARFLSNYATAVQIFPMVSPLIGGYIVHYTNWSYIFFALAAFSAIFFLVHLFFLPESNPHVGEVPLKPRIWLKNYLNIIREPMFYSNAIGTGGALL